MAKKREPITVQLTPEDMEKAERIGKQRWEWSQGHDDILEPMPGELGVLARDYLECLYQGDYIWEAFRQTGTMRFEAFAQRRLNTIQRILGKKEFELRVQAIREKWEPLLKALRSSPSFC